VGCLGGTIVINKILSTHYDAESKSFEIYFAGCNRHCVGCHNPESWDFEAGEPYNYLAINRKIKEFGDLIDNIKLMGGEPLDQSEIYKITSGLYRLGKKLWLFTGREPWEVPIWCYGVFDYIKTGGYREDLRTDDNICYGIKLASSNQKLYKKGVEYGDIKGC
jgi:anaerobic ribonucleoside-triphosphate reductase activating protein